MFRIVVVAALLAVARGAVCLVCGEGKVVTAPAALVTFPGQEPIPCADLQLGGINGDAQVVDNCAFIQSFIATTCACAAGTLPPTTAPGTDAPAAPVESPVASEAPAGSEPPISEPPTEAPTAPPTAPPTPSPTPVPTSPRTPAPTLGGSTVVGKMMMKKKKAKNAKKEKLVKVNP